MDYFEASKKFLRGDRDPKIISALKEWVDIHENVWLDGVEGNPQYNIRLNFALDRLSKMPSKLRILEVGSYTGNFANVYQNLGHDVVCLEGCYSAVTVARDIWGVDVVYGQICDLHINDKFDVVCAFEVLEHLTHPDEMVEKFKKILNPGGSILITIPTEDRVLNSKTIEDYEGGEHIQIIDEARIRSWGAIESFRYNYTTTSWYMVRI